ncbi:hypothetical protein [Arthrobacter sp. SDTb3-6]|uniref:hypothetical protein n=1 Tax=Arthrobacter sp. SDTb3-6 TaxID=2713571 RepID=UPI00159D091A|nr:hypothetical protein [Arthrobacter sp. SDTb3-6]NVM99327.1 hypothetical protein [Arthrobacter sp. SDTb3-6]
MGHRPELPPHLAMRSFTRSEGARGGLTISRMRAKDLYVPSREIRVPLGAQQSYRDRVRPYTELGVENYISHTSAAILHGIPMPYVHEQARSVHLTRPAGTMIPRRKGVTGHKRALSPEECTLVDGIPVTTPARTLLDLSAILTLGELVAAADHLICEHDRDFEAPKIAIVTAAGLRAYIASKRFIRGLGNAQAAMELMRVGVDSPPETRLRLLLQRAGLPEFTTNHRIPGAPGERTVLPDLACEEFRVCGEYEGEVHLTPEKQLFDRNRDMRTAARGWLQVKVFKKDMQRGDAWVAGMFREALREHGWNPG